MVHLNQYQYPSLRKYTAVIRMELMKRNLRKVLSEQVILRGQELGLSNDEIYEIRDTCYEDLIRVYNN